MPATANPPEVIVVHTELWRHIGCIEDAAEALAHATTNEEIRTAYGTLAGARRDFCIWAKENMPRPEPLYRITLRF